MSTELIPSLPPGVSADAVHADLAHDPAIGLMGVLITDVGLVEFVGGEARFRCPMEDCDRHGRHGQRRGRASDTRR
jgi:hypothetical protein